MDRHVLKDEEGFMNDEQRLKPALDSAGSHQKGIDALSKESADETLLFGPEGAVRTLVRQYECINKQHSRSASALSSDSSLSGYSSVWTSGRTIPSSGDPGISSKNGASVDTLNRDGTHFCHPSRYLNSQAHAAASRNEFEVTISEPKASCSESSLASAGPGTNQREGDPLPDGSDQEETSCVRGSNDSYGDEISVAYAAPSRFEYNFTMLEPKSIPAHASDLLLASPGTDPQNNGTLDGLEDSDTGSVPDLNVSYETGSSGSAAARRKTSLETLRRKYHTSPPKGDDLEIPQCSGSTDREEPPGSHDVPDLNDSDETGSSGSAAARLNRSLERLRRRYCPEKYHTSPLKVATLGIPQSRENAGLNETFREGTCRSFLSPYDDEYAMSPVLELAGPGTCPQTEATLVAPEQDEPHPDGVGPCVLSESNDFFGKEISHFLAGSGSSEHKMTAPEPESLPMKSSVPKTGGQKCLTLFAPKKDESHGVPDSNDVIGEALSQFLAGPNGNGCNLEMAEPNSTLDTSGRGSRSQADATLNACVREEPHGVRSSNVSLLEELNISFASPCRDDPADSTFAEDPDLESGGFRTIPQDGSEQEIILPDSYETFREEMMCMVRQNEEISKDCPIL